MDDRKGRPYANVQKSGRTEISVRPLYLGYPPVEGKKQEGVGRKGGEKTLTGGIFHTRPPGRVPGPSWTG